MNKLHTDINGGFPFSLDDLRWIDESIRDSIKGFMSTFGIADTEAFILSGLVYTDNGTSFSLTEGYVVIEGEVCHFQAQTINNPPSGQAAYFEIDVTYDPTRLVTFENGMSHDVYEVRKAKLITGSDTTTGVTFYDDTKRIFDIIRENLPELANIPSNTSDINGNKSDITLLISNYAQLAADLIGVNTTLAVNATETVLGRIKIATQTETNAGTDDTKAITPLKLKGVQASVTQVGVTKFADALETALPSVSNKAITPASLWGSNLIGIILLRGTVYLGNFPLTANGTDTVALGANVGTTNYIVTGSMRVVSGAFANSNDVIWSVQNKTATSFDIVGHKINSANTGDLEFEYVLIKI